LCKLNYSRIIMIAKQNRILEIDFTRGIAVVFMIISHIGMFGIITLNNIMKNQTVSGSTAMIFGGIGTIAHTLFILLVGVNMTTSYNRVKAKHLKMGHDENETKRQIHREFILKNIRRGGFIFLLGVLMSVIVKVVFGEWLVFFGIFQFIAVAIVMAIPFTLYYNHITNALAIILILVSTNYRNQLDRLSGLGGPGLGLGFITGNTNRKFIDFFPILPYFSYVLVGIMIGKMLEGVRLSGMNMRSTTVRNIVYTGQNSIQVYFTQLIIIFAIMKAVIGNKKIAV
jgi:uncharacterized membrane protein